MEIILGHWLDSKAYPDEFTSCTASIGKVITGFRGLINILEVQLGQSNPTISESVRIAEWQTTIAKLDDGNKPYSRSFKTDSWNTARELKKKRDELVLAGWNPNIHIGGGKWIESIAEIELSNHHHSKGFSDRVRILFELLNQKYLPLNIKKISLVDEDDSIWENWEKELVLILKQIGIQFEQIELQLPVVSDQPTNDLERIKLALYDANSTFNFNLSGDGSFIIVRSEQEWDAADFLISWLEVNGDDQTVLINNTNNLLLTELFHRRGLPSSEINEFSKWRSALQVLPLTLDTYWQPIRIDRIMELLTLPISPLPKKLCYKLARVISEEPGIGGDRWHAAIGEAVSEIETTWLEQGFDSKKLNKKKQELFEQIDVWINHEYYDTSDGIPCSVIESICRKISKWAFNKNLYTPNPVFAQAHSSAMELIEGIRVLNIEKIDQLQLANILGSILGDGIKLPNYIEELAPWSNVQQPGAIWGAVDNILWWEFTQNTTSQLNKLTDAERAFLKSHNVHLVSPELIRKRENESWHNAIRFANKRVILFIPSKVRAEDVKAHPLLDEIRFALSKIEQNEHQITINPSILYKQEKVTIIENEFKRVGLANKEIPSPIQQWKLPEHKVKLREIESATSFETVLSCPLKWTLQYSAKVQPSNALSLPNESIMLGNLGHAILERLIDAQVFTTDSDIQEMTGSLYDELVPKLAAPLLLPENQSLRSRVRNDLQKSMRQFANFLDVSKIVITETESSHQKIWQDEIEFEGRLDLIGKTPSNRTVILDAKWSRRPANYKQKLIDGSIQLALYQWLMSTSDDEVLPVAYFMLSSGDIYSVKNAEIPEQYHIDSVALNDTVQLIRHSLGEIQGSLDSGIAIATGIELDEAAAFKPLCSFCDYQDLCGIRRNQL
ncbi:PD-(D/E)XK nuclease family protein [Metasolibacillus sp. FSL H7-0170]|uniref:PD-(D/E)XK nuclease family protein n=1 Tax=Metasolibacillus sp. FSL H7-0170 TaxID=2921431 RepID=UPI0031587201